MQKETIGEKVLLLGKRGDKRQKALTEIRQWSDDERWLVWYLGVPGITFAVARIILLAVLGIMSLL